MVIMSVKTTVLLGVAALVVVIGAVVAIVVHPLAGNKAAITYGSMDGYTVDKVDVDRLSEAYYAATPTEIAQTLLDNHLYGLMAKALNITVSTADVQTGIGVTPANPHPYGEAYLSLLVQDNLYKAQLLSKLTPGISGRYIYLHFDQDMMTAGGSVDENLATLTDAQLKALIVSDQSYALQLANQLYAKIHNGTITFDQAMQLEKSDPRLGEGPLSTLDQSGNFDTATEVASSYGLTTQKQLLSVIKTTPVKAYTKVLTGTVPVAMTSNAKRVDGYYVIFIVDDINAGNHKYGDFGQMLTSFKKQNNYQGPKL